MDKIFIGIPSGKSKAYCLLIMAHALQHLQEDNIEIHWALSDLGTPECKQYHEDVDKAMSLTGREYYIHDVPLTGAEAKASYVAILKNRNYLRGVFLDTDCTEYFTVGGDNPPWLNAVQLLRDMDADVAFGVAYQRPGVDHLNRGVYPLLWRQLWTMKDVDKHDIPRKIRNALRKMYINESVVLPIYLEEGWEKQPYLEDVVGGDGNCLLRRPVLEEFGWIMPTHSKISEDMLFMRTVSANGYTVRCNPNYRVPHIHEEDMRSY